MKADLQEAERILRKYGHARQASVMSALQDLEERDQAAFEQKLQSVEMWVVPGPSGRSASTRAGVTAEEAQRDLHCFWEALIRIAHQMEHRGLGTNRSPDIASTLNPWLGQKLARVGAYTPLEYPAARVPLPDVQFCKFLSTQRQGIRV